MLLNKNLPKDYLQINKTLFLFLFFLPFFFNVDNIFFLFIAKNMNLYTFKFSKIKTNYVIYN